MIKSKIDARERALEFVTSLGLHDRELIMDMAMEFTNFLVGDAELPEFVSNVDDMLEAVELLKKQMPEFSKTENGQMEFLLPAPRDRKLMTENEADNFKSVLGKRGYINLDANILLGTGGIYEKSFDGFNLRLYINKRVGGYVVSPAITIGEGMDAPRFSIADYNLDIDRIEGAALKIYGCYCETISVDEGA